MNNFHHSKPTRLSKVYFVWVIRDFGTAEWFHSLLHAIEEQDTQNRIEISIYLTAKIKEDDMNNILVQDVGAERDAITSLRAPTHFGRPNWDRVFGSIADKNPETDIGVFFCGPAALSTMLHRKSIKYSSARGARFFYGKGTPTLPSQVFSVTNIHFRELLKRDASLLVLDAIWLIFDVLYLIGCALVGIAIFLFVMVDKRVPRWLWCSCIVQSIFPSRQTSPVN
jgi:hypothetical protein